MMVWTNEIAEESTRNRRQINPLLHELMLENPFTGVYAASQRIDALNRVLSRHLLVEWTKATPDAIHDGIHPALWKAAAVATLDGGVNSPATDFDSAELQQLALHFACRATQS
jgi:hypothetical protein